MRRFALTTTALLFSSCFLQAGEKDLMHCFAWTPIATATQADWDAFYKATDALPQKISSVKSVWVGKLARPLTLLTTADAEARKKAAAGEKATAELTAQRREHGACFAIKGGSEPAAILKEYASHPYHKEWLAAYEKVRVAGTTTYDIVGR